MDLARIPFVDAHLHFWDLQHLRYPWLQPPFSDAGPNGSVEAIARDYLDADYRRDVAGWTVAGAVHVDAGAHPQDALAETEWLEEQAGASGLPNAIVAFADLCAPDVEGALAAQAAHALVNGIRHIVNWHPDPARTYTPVDLTRREDWVRGFAALARHDLSFDLQCYPGQMAQVAALARRHPAVSIMVNHLGMPVLTDPDGREAWRNGLRTLAALPQISIKLSGLGFVRRDWDVALVLPLLREAIDIFGPDRCMAASDFPTDHLFASPDRVMGALAEALQAYGPDEQRAIWGGNACRLYRINPAILGEQA